MRTPPDISAVIPTRNRAAKLANLLSRLAAQTLPADRFEAVIVLDGPDPHSRAVAERFHHQLNITLLEAPRLGIAHAKNVAITAARGRLLLLLNDDIRPIPTFLEAHLRAHNERPPHAPALIVGYSPFLAPPPDSDTLFDRLLRETSLIFFYDRMIDPSGRTTATPEHDWGYRHAWNLNLSLPREAALLVGGFRPAIANCCYEDVEFADRLRRRLATPVLFRPDARADHDHPMTPDDYLQREFRLGYSALAFAHAAPDCAIQIFGRDLRTTTPATAENDLKTPDFGPFRSLSTRSSTGIDSAALAAIYAEHIPLKRHVFRQGLRAAMQNQRFAGLFSLADGLAAEPPLAALPAA